MKRFGRIILIVFSALAVMVLGLYLSAVFLVPKALNSPAAIKKIENFVSNKTKMQFDIRDFSVKSTKKLEYYIKADTLILNNKEGRNILTANEFEGHVKLFKLKSLKAYYLYFNQENLPLKNIPGAKPNFTKLQKISKIDVKEGKINLKNGITFDFENLKARKTQKGSRLTFAGEISSKEKIVVFRDVTTKIAADIYLQNEDITGKATLEDFNGKMAIAFVDGAPVHFNNAEFNFEKGGILVSNAPGNLAGEEARHKLKIYNVFSDQRDVFGEVETVVTPLSVKFIKGFNVLNNTNINIKYAVKEGNIDTKYVLDVKKGSDVFYKGAHLGLRDKERRIFIHTLKEGNQEGSTLWVKNYRYSILNNKEYQTIMEGNSLFVKKKGHYRPNYVSARTNGYVPASVTGSFNRYISGGEFKGNLRYDFIKKLLTGDFTVRHCFHKDFFVKTAQINATKSDINVTAIGTYRFEPYECKLHAKNNSGLINGRITVYDMDLFLNRYIIRTAHKHTNEHKTSFREKIQKRRQMLRHKVKDIDLTVDNWTIFVKHIIKDRAEFNNVRVNGSLKEDVFKFQTSDISFAEGVLRANGRYYFKNNSSDIVFSAANINSTIAADLLFNLKNQIEGTANGKVHINTYNRLKDIKALVEFSIDEGFLPKLGSKEFIMGKKKKRFRLSKIFNIDLTDSEALAASIKGCFYMDNSKLENIFLTSKQRYLSLLIEGNYDIKEENVDLVMYGKYNSKAQSRLKVLFIPVKFIIKIFFRPESTYKNYKTKLDKIPDIEAKPGETKYFRVKFKGILNTNNVDIETKSIVY